MTPLAEVIEMDRWLTLTVLRLWLLFWGAHELWFTSTVIAAGVIHLSLSLFISLSLSHVLSSHLFPRPWACCSFHPTEIPFHILMLLLLSFTCLVMEPSGQCETFNLFLNGKSGSGVITRKRKKGAVWKSSAPSFANMGRQGNSLASTKRPLCLRQFQTLQRNHAIGPCQEGLGCGLNKRKPTSKRQLCVCVYVCIYSCVHYVRNRPLPCSLRMHPHQTRQWAGWSLNQLLVIDGHWPKGSKHHQSGSNEVWKQQGCNFRV